MRRILRRIVFTEIGVGWRVILLDWRRVAIRKLRSACHEGLFDCEVIDISIYYLAEDTCEYSPLVFIQIFH